VKIADNRDLAALIRRALDNLRYRRRRILVVDRHPDDLRSRVSEGDDLRRGRRRVCGIGIGHRLHDDRVIAADRDVSDPRGWRLSTLGECHGPLSVLVIGSWRLPLT
jgi:hypothetical protein